MVTVIQGRGQWEVRSDWGTLLGYGNTPNIAIERAKRHPKIVELGAEIVIREQSDAR